ncbi:MAG: hypothetical protein LC772_06265 [Chloroflexi bacterium]|nr:hypothetical protein [Chloroflexota bacterium]
MDGPGMPLTGVGSPTMIMVACRHVFYQRAGNVSHHLPLEAAPEAYEKFDKRTHGYTKVVLKPAM